MKESYSYDNGGSDTTTSSMAFDDYYESNYEPSYSDSGSYRRKRRNAEIKESQFCTEYNERIEERIIEETTIKVRVSPGSNRTLRDSSRYIYKIEPDIL